MIYKRTTVYSQTKMADALAAGYAATLFFNRRPPGQRTPAALAPVSDTKSAPTNDAHASDDDANSDDDMMPPQPSEDTMKRCYSLPAPAQLNNIFTTYADFSLTNIKFDNLNITDPPSAPHDARDTRAVPVPGSDNSVKVVDGLNTSLKNLVRELFKDVANNKDVLGALQNIVANKALPGKQNKERLRRFYDKLLQVITVLQVACEKEDTEAPRDSRSTRRPNLELWVSVLANLTSLQCVFQKGAHDGLMELDDTKEPGVAIWERNKQIAKTRRDIGVNERFLIDLHGRLADHDQQLLQLESRYSDIKPRIQQANAQIHFLQQKLQSFTDIPLLVAETVANMQTSVSGHQTQTPAN